MHGRPSSLWSPLLSCAVPLAHHTLPSSVLSQNFAPDLLARTILPACLGVASFSSSLSIGLRAILSQSPSWALKEATPAATLPVPPTYLLHIINRYLCDFLYLFVPLFIVCLPLKRPELYRCFGEAARAWHIAQ